MERCDRHSRWYRSRLPKRYKSTYGYIAEAVGILRGGVSHTASVLCRTSKIQNLGSVSRKGTSMVNTNNHTTEKESYRSAVLEIIGFSCEDIVTASVIAPNEKGDNLTDNNDDYYWWD